MIFSRIEVVNEHKVVERGEEIYENICVRIRLVVNVTYVLDQEMARTELAQWMIHKYQLGFPPKITIGRAGQYTSTMTCTLPIHANAIDVFKDLQKIGEA